MCEKRVIQCNIPKHALTCPVKIIACFRRRGADTKVQQIHGTE